MTSMIFFHISPSLSPSLLLIVFGSLDFGMCLVSFSSVLSFYFCFRFVYNLCVDLTECVTMNEWKWNYLTWHRQTISACVASISTTFPLPSSPHCAPAKLLKKKKRRLQYKSEAVFCKIVLIRQSVFSVLRYRGHTIKNNIDNINWES